MKKISIAGSLLLLLLSLNTVLLAQGLETFDNLELSGSSYVDGSFVGNNGITWNYTHVAGEQSYPIDGKGMLLRRSGENSKIVSEEISGGIGNFSVQLRKAYTATGIRQVELFINGVSKGKSLEFGSASGADPTIHSFVVDNINIEGDFTLEIRHITGGDQNRQLVIDNITWTAYDGKPPVATPVFSHATGSYYSDFLLSITSATEDAVIRYTTDNSNPTENSDIYTTPITISETTTVKAQAFKDDMGPSLIAMATFSFVSVVDVADVATLKASPQDNTIYRLTGEVVLTYQQSFRGNKFIQDDTGGILIDDDTGVITTSYALLDGIRNIVGNISTYNGQVQLVPVTNTPAAVSHNNIVYPVTVTINQLNNNILEYQSRLIKIDGATFTSATGTNNFANGQTYPVSDGTGTISFRTSFYDVNYIGQPIPTGAINMVVLQNSRAEGNFITARFLADFDAVPPNTVSTPIISPPAGQYGDPITVSIVCYTEGAEIYYTTNGTNPNSESTLYTVPISIDESKTVKAIAVKDGMNESAIAEAVYEIGYTSIKDIRDNFAFYNGKTVAVAGIVTVGSGTIHGTQLNAYIQDESGRGIMMFAPSLDPNVQRGHKLQVTGVIGEYQGKTQITGFTYSILETGLDIPVIELSIPEAQDYQKWEGTMIQVSGSLYENPYYAGGGYNINIQNEAGNRMLVRVWDSTGIDTSRLVKGVPITARGPAGVFSNSTQILPAYQEDIIIDIKEPVIENIDWEPKNDYVDVPYNDQPITVKATAFDYDGTIDTVTMRYRLESSPTVLATVDMTLTSNDVYQAVLPSLDTYTDFEDNFVVTIEATDNDGLVARSSARIVVSLRKPVVHSVTFTAPIAPGDSLVVKATIFDTVGEIEEAKLYYYLNYRTTRYETPFTKTRSTYTGFIPPQSPGTIVQVTIFAVNDNDLITEQRMDQFGNEIMFTFPVDSHEALLRIPPVVFNPRDGEEIPIGFFSKAGNNATLRIYNAEGKLKFTPRNMIIANQDGINYYNWDGRDRNYEILPIGLYICHLEVIDKNTGKKKTATAPIVIGTQLK